MITYIIACDYEEYWAPIAATNDEGTAEAIYDAATLYVIEKLRAKHQEMVDDDPETTPFNEEEAMETAAKAIIITPQRPTFVEEGTPMLPDEVVAELDRQLSESYGLLEGGW